MKEWDIFLSHASEDKEAAAVPLADSLERAGIRVWFDDRQLRMGDSIREKVEEGLSRSRYGAVILSPSFVAKQWPRRELNALFALEEGGAPLILPVWHNIDRAAVLSYSPILADRLAANTNDGFGKVARSISAVVLSDPASPATRAPGLEQRLLSLLGDAANPRAVKAFLLAHPQILGYAIAGRREVQVRGGVHLGSVTADIFAGTFGLTSRSWTWHLFMLGGAGDHPAAADDPLGRLAGQVGQMRRWAADNLRAARADLPDVRADFGATILLARRTDLSPADTTALRDFNESAIGIQAHTFDWLADVVAQRLR